MIDEPGNVRTIRIEDEMRVSYLDYAMSVIVSRALPDVQKALSWAYRSMATIAAPATIEALRAEARIAAANGDGHRAWVIRDSLSKLDPDDAAAIREELIGIRRSAGAAATSRAAELADQFAEMGLGRLLPEPPLT